MAPQARQMAADGHGRGLDCSDALVVSARLQPAVGVNNAPCNGRAKVSESGGTSLYMYSEVGKLVVNSDFDPHYLICYPLIPLGGVSTSKVFRLYTRAPYSCIAPQACGTGRVRYIAPLLAVTRLFNKTPSELRCEYGKCITHERANARRLHATHTSV